MTLTPALSLMEKVPKRPTLDESLSFRKSESLLPMRER
jgi:hypothetical protein